MRFATPNNKARTGAFTLAEVLAALMFLAIVIPVAVEGMEIASHAGEVATRKGDAARIAEQVLNENLVTTNWNTGLQNGTIVDNGQSYSWTLRNTAWTGDPAMNAMQQLSVDVNYTVQSRVYTVSLSTLVSNGTP
jgi:type II secretory pathway pseudopilin PulG